MSFYECNNSMFLINQFGKSHILRMRIVRKEVYFPRASFKPTYSEDFDIHQCLKFSDGIILVIDIIIVTFLSATILFIR